MIHDMDIANQTFPAFRSDLNNALKALASNSSNDTSPGTTQPHQFWVDTASNSDSTLFIRNKSNNAWINVGVIGETGNTFLTTSSTNSVNATNSTNIRISPDNTTNTNRFITFTTANPTNPTNQQLYTDSNLLYNPSTNTLTTNVSGNVSGTAGSLASSVTILGQTFNGTQNISLTAGDGINISGGNTISVTGALNVTSLTTSGGVVANNGIQVKASSGTEGGEIQLFNTGGSTVGLFIDVSTANTGRIWQNQLNSVMQIGQLASTGGKIEFYVNGGVKGLELNSSSQLQLLGNRFYHYDGSFVEGTAPSTINVPAANFEMGFGVGTGNRRFYGISTPAGRYMAFYSNGVQYFTLTTSFAIPIFKIGDGITLSMQQASLFYNYGFNNPASSSAEMLCIDSSGYVGKVAPSTNRVKMNVATLEDASFVMNLRPVTFKRKKMINGVYVNTPLSDKIEYGFIAEEAALVDERLATYEKIRDDNGNIVIQPNGISYAQFLAPAIRFAQQLKEEIDLLKEEIRELRGMIQ